MKEFHALRIFISYGHDKHVVLAERLKKDLESRGHEVWFDADRIKPGRDWETYIENGIDWVSEVPVSGRMVILLTPHSVRRPDGYCLNELSRALKRGLSLVPIMVAWCEPPLSICRIQWLDMRDCVPIQDRESFYESKFGRLAEALELDQLDFEGTQSRLLHRLQPLPFDAEITQHLQRFTGRQWMIDRIDTWLSNPQASRIFWIIGKPGVGKTALAAWLCYYRREVAAFHLCKYGHTQKSDPRRCVLSIAYQLSSQIPEYQTRIDAMDLEKIISESNPRTLFDLIIVQPLSVNLKKPKQTIVVLIDALDEASEGGKNELADFIGAEFSKLPQWFRLIITSRPDPEVTRPLQALTPIVLDASGPENENDIRAFLSSELQSFTKGSEVPKATIDTILARSEGIFLYVEQIRRELEEGRLSLEHMDEFPQGLGSIFWEFFNRQFQDLIAYENNVRPVLEVLLAAQEPLSVNMLASMFKWGEYDKNHIIEHLGSIFPVSAGNIQPFHRSVIDWLIDNSKAGSYFVNIENGHKRLADYCWKDYQESAPDFSNYTLYLPIHLIKAQCWQQLENLLCDLRFIEAKCKAGMTFDLVDDYNITLMSMVGEKAKSRSRIEEYGRFLKTNAHILVTNSHLVFQQAANQPDMSEPAVAAKALLKSNLKKCWLEWSNKPRDMDPCLMTLSGHTNWVRSCVFSPDGNSIISGSSDRTLKIWKATTGEEINTLVGHTGGIGSCAFSPDGKNIVSGSDDWTLKVWDFRNGDEIVTLNGHSDQVWACAYSPKGQYIASGSWDGTLRLWEIETAREVATFIGHDSGVVDCGWSPDGELIVSASYDKTLKIWKVHTGELLVTLNGHTAAVEACSFLPDGEGIISASQDGTLRLWNWRKGLEHTILAQHTTPIMACSCNTAGDRIVSASEGGILQVIDPTDGKIISELSGHSQGINSCSFSPDGKRLISGSRDETLKIWEPVQIDKDIRLPNFNGGVQVCEFSNDGQWMVSAGGREVGLWNVEKLTELFRLKEHEGVVVSCALSADGKRLVSGSQDHTLNVWDIQKGIGLHRLIGHSDWINTCVYSPDGSRILSASQDKTLMLWNSNDGRCIKTFMGHIDAVTDCHFSPDGAKILSAAGANIELWDSVTGEKLTKLAGHPYEVTACNFSPDGRLIVSASYDRSLKIWDTVTGEEVAELAGHQWEVANFAFLPDGRQIVSGCADGTLRIWDIRTKECRAELLGHTKSKRVNACACSLDGQWIVSVSNDRTVRVWNVHTGEEIALFVASGAIGALARIRGGGLIAMGDDLGHVYLLRLKVIKSEPTLVTPVRLYRFENDTWDDKFTVICEYCGQHFILPEKILSTIEEIKRNARLNQLNINRSPILYLPDEAWEDQRLISECSQCQGLLKYNPFVVVCGI